MGKRGGTTAVIAVVFGRGMPWDAPGDGLRDPASEARDTPGTGLCTSGTGTGVNAHDRPGGVPSRHGDSPNGGCGQQIRVTDIENTPAK